MITKNIEVRIITMFNKKNANNNIMKYLNLKKEHTGKIQFIPIKNKE